MDQHLSEVDVADVADALGTMGMGGAGSGDGTGLEGDGSTQAQSQLTPVESGVSVGVQEVQEHLGFRSDMGSKEVCIYVIVHVCMCVWVVYIYVSVYISFTC